MSSVFTLTGIFCWYWWLALVITIYQAYRGFRFQWLLGIDSLRKIAAEAAQSQRAQLAARQAQVAQQPQAVQQPKGSWIVS